MTTDGNANDGRAELSPVGEDTWKQVIEVYRGGIWPDASHC